MTTWLNKAFLYTIAWSIYCSQGLFFPKGTFFSQLLVIILLLISLYHFFVVNIRYKLSGYFWGLNAIVAMFTIYGTFLMVGGYDSSDYAIRVDSFNYLKTIYISLLPIYSFYFFSKEKLISEKTIYVFIVLFLLLVTGEFFEERNEMMLMALLANSSAEEFVNNVGYSFVSLFPIAIFLYKKPFLQYIMICYCIFFVFFAMKRGAIVVAFICFVFFLWNNIKNVDLKKKCGIIFLVTSLCIIGGGVLQDKMSESILFQSRVEKTIDGNSSGRDALYSTFINYFWNDATPLQFVFGSGANATLKVSYNYAHNDWLEIAVNQGLVGVVLYLFYWFFFAKAVFSQKYSSYPKSALQLIFIIYFMRTIFSMSYANMTIPATFCLGFCLSQENENENNIKNI